MWSGAVHYNQQRSVRSEPMRGTGRKNHVWLSFIRLGYFLISCFDLNLTPKAYPTRFVWGAKLDGFFETYQ
jgi:hypothetical protein